MVQADQFVRVQSDIQPRWYRFSGTKLDEVCGMRPGSVPLAYNASLNLLAAKSLSGEGVGLTFYRGGSGTLTELITRDYPADEITSLCMTDTGTVWMLHQGRYEKNDTGRQYILSRGTTALAEWENHFLTSERSGDTFGGSVIEKPGHLFCGPDQMAVYLSSFLYSDDDTRGILRLPRLSLLQIYLYRFDLKESVIYPIAGFTPRKNGMVHEFYDPRTGRFYLFQNEILATQKGLGFPDEQRFVGADNILFARDSDASPLFLIGKPQNDRVVGRIAVP
jgi:hypothetical protein